MTRSPGITPQRRAHLRRLKAEFDAAYADVDVSDRTSEAYRVAESLYKDWRRAIDADAITLLDDLDALDTGDGAGPGPGSPQPPLRQTAATQINKAEIDHVFADMDDLKQLREAIGGPQSPFEEEPI